MAPSKRAPLTFKTDNVTAVAAESVSALKTGLPASEKTSKQENGQAKPGREGRQFIAAHVLPDAAKQFKLLAVQRDTTTQDLLIEAINDLFAKHGLSRIA